MARTDILRHPPTRQTLRQLKSQLAKAEKRAKKRKLEHKKWMAKVKKIKKGVAKYQAENLRRLNKGRK